MPTRSNKKQNKHTNKTKQTKNTANSLNSTNSNCTCGNSKINCIEKECKLLVYFPLDLRHTDLLVTVHS